MCSSQCWKFNLVQMAASAAHLNGLDISIVKLVQDSWLREMETKQFSDKGRIYSIELQVHEEIRRGHGSELFLLGKCSTPENIQVWHSAANWEIPSSSQISLSEFFHRVQELIESKKKHTFLKLMFQVKISKQKDNTNVKRFIGHQWKGESISPALYELFSGSNSLGYYDVVIGHSAEKWQVPFYATFYRSFPLDTDLFSAAMGFLSPDVGRALHFGVQME